MTDHEIQLGNKELKERINYLEKRDADQLEFEHCVSCLSRCSYEEENNKMFEAMKTMFIQFSNTRLDARCSNSLTVILSAIKELKTLICSNCYYYDTSKLNGIAQREGKEACSTCDDEYCNLNPKSYYAPPED